MERSYTYRERGCDFQIISLQHATTSSRYLAELLKHTQKSNMLLSSKVKTVIIVHSPRNKTNVFKYTASRQRVQMLLFYYSSL